MAGPLAHAIDCLQRQIETAEHNASIHDAEGDHAQALLCRETAASCRVAVGLLSAHGEKLAHPAYVVHTIGPAQAIESLNRKIEMLNRQAGVLHDNGLIDETAATIGEVNDAIVAVHQLMDEQARETPDNR